MELLEFITRATDHYRLDGRVDLLQRPAIITYRATSFLALCEALLYKHTGIDAHRDRSLRLLLHVDPHAYLDPRPNNALFGTPAAAVAAGILDTSGALDGTDLERVASWTFPRLADVLATQLRRNPPRLHNHAMLAMAGARLFADLVPDHSLAPQLLERSAALWHDFWSLRDNLEVASLYEPYSVLSQILYANAAGHAESFWMDPDVRLMFERGIDTVTPIGLQSTYGDGQWLASWGIWVAVFSAAAARYREGRYVWAAERLLSFARESGVAAWPEALDHQPVHSVETEQVLTSHYLIEIHGLAFADLLGDTAGSPAPPTERVKVTTRRAAVDGERIPERVILRTGPERTDLHCTLPILHRLTGHQQYDAGSIGTLVAQSTILLAPTGYFWRDPRFHNTLLVRPESETFLDPYDDDHPPEPTAYRVDHIDASNVSLLAQISCDRVLGFPIRHRREVSIDPITQAVTVHDRVSIEQGAFTVSPLYHFENVSQTAPTEFLCRTSAAYRNIAIEIPNGPSALQLRADRTSVPTQLAQPEPHPDVFGTYSVPEWVEMYRTWRLQHICIHWPTVVSENDSCEFTITLIPTPAQAQP